MTTKIPINVSTLDYSLSAPYSPPISFSFRYGQAWLVEAIPEMKLRVLSRRICPALSDLRRNGIARVRRRGVPQIVRTSSLLSP
jgi:hypothetical protein